MSTPENTTPAADNTAAPATATEIKTEASATETKRPVALEASITINAPTFMKVVSTLFFAGIGGAGVMAAFWALSFIGSLFATVMPFVFGGFLFAAIVVGFKLLIDLQKNIRRSNKLKVSVSEGYTAVTIFIAMGFFATACMHAFMGDGLALSHWTYGVSTIAIAATGYGLGKFFGSLWADGGKAR